jgi:hypothetical protein
VGTSGIVPVESKTGFLGVGGRCPEYLIQHLCPRYLRLFFLIAMEYSRNKNRLKVISIFGIHILCELLFFPKVQR